MAGPGEPTEIGRALIDIYSAPDDASLAAMDVLYERAIDAILDEQDAYSSHDRYVEAAADVRRLKDSGAFDELRQDRTTSLNVRFNRRVRGIRDAIFRDRLKTGIVLAGFALVAGGLAGKAAYVRRLIGLAPDLAPAAGVVADAIGDTLVGGATKLPNAVARAGKFGVARALGAVGKAGEAVDLVLRKPEFVADRLVRGGLNPADAAFLKLARFEGPAPAGLRFEDLNIPGLSWARIDAADGDGSRFLIRWSRALEPDGEGFLVSSREIRARDLPNYEGRLTRLAERNRDVPRVVEVDPVTRRIEVLETPASALTGAIEGGGLSPALKKFDWLAGGFATLGVGAVEAVAFSLGEPFGRRDALAPEDLYLDSVLGANKGATP